MFLEENEKADALAKDGSEVVNGRSNGGSKRFNQTLEEKQFCVNRNKRHVFMSMWRNVKDREMVSKEKNETWQFRAEAKGKVGDTAQNDAETLGGEFTCTRYGKRSKKDMICGTCHRFKWMGTYFNKTLNTQDNRHH